MTEGTNRGGQDSGPMMFDIPAVIAAAHELKAPLALVRQLSLVLGNGTCSPKELEQIAHKITLTSERALRLTTDLTRAARLENSIFTLQPLNPLSLCEEVAEELAPLYSARGRQIAARGRRYSLLAVANYDLLRRILLNFADNALHYSAPDAPVVLTAASRDRGQTIRLGVRDYGPALPASIWKSMSGSIERYQQSLHARPASSGLGIHIAHQFAEAMGAQVGATRHRDGVTFYVDVSASTQLRLL